MDLNKFFSELKRRNVYKVALTYAITSWFLAQIVALAAETFQAPDWVTKIVFVLLVIGFPIALILAWAFELSPQGMIRTNSPASEENPYPLSKKKPFTSNLLIGVLAFIIIGQFAYNKYGGDEPAIADSFDNSIAVLPFDDLSSEGDTEWFCDGMTEDILTRLSKIKELKVISRSSVMQYKENRPSIPEIAKALGVSYILEGSVRKHEDKIVITAQLIDANDKHLWADNFNDSFKEVFDIQKKVSLKIVQQLEIAIDPYENSQIAEIPTKNMQAYELFLKARSFSDRGTKEDFKRGVELYRQAIAIDPDFLEAHIELAWSYLFNGYLDVDNQDENFEEIKILVDKASEINPESGYVHLSNGILNLFENKEEAARLNFEKGLVLLPNSAYANDIMSVNYFYGEHKDFDKAMYHINRAVELDPFSAIISEHKVAGLLEIAKVEEAEQFFKEKISLFSEYNKSYLSNAILIGKAEKLVKEKKDWTQAIAFYENEIEKQPNNAEMYRLLGSVYDGVMNDDENYIKYAQRAYELDSTESAIALEYATALIEGNRFDDAKKLMDSKNYRSSQSSSGELSMLVYYYYHKQEYDRALEVLKDPLLNNLYDNYRVFSLAQKGNEEEVRELLNGNGFIGARDKAYVFAILKNRDSMYFYMDKADDNKNAINSRREVDPYRKEQRYIEYLEKNYMPITHWNK